MCINWKYSPSSFHFTEMEELESSVSSHKCPNARWQWRGERKSKEPCHISCVFLWPIRCCSFWTPGEVDGNCHVTSSLSKAAGRRLLECTAVLAPWGIALTMGLDGTKFPMSILWETFFFYPAIDTCWFLVPLIFKAFCSSISLLLSSFLTFCLPWTQGDKGDIFYPLQCGRQMLTYTSASWFLLLSRDGTVPEVSLLVAVTQEVSS